MANQNFFQILKFCSDSAALTLVFYSLVGVIAAIALIIYTVISTPIFLYRWILTKFVAPFYPNIGKVVSASGQYFAIEFLGNPSPTDITTDPPQLTKSGLTTSRCGIICNMFCSGTVPLEDVSQLISEGWLSLKPGETQLKYPEFQQYIEMWNGFMFWKHDTNFLLENHINLHVIPHHAKPAESEEYLNNLVEVLMSRKFPLKKSPWEVHLIQNYRNPAMEVKGNQSEDGVITVVLFRVHHAMVDGYSVLNAILEGLLGHDITSLGVASPKIISSEAASKGRSYKDFMSIRKLFNGIVYVPWRCVHDLGYLACLKWRFLGESQSPWYVADRDKKWEVIYGKSELIPVEKIKFIKNQFNVSFTAVLISCLGAAAAQCYKQKGYTGKPILPLGSIVPLKHHPKNLRNHSTTTVMDISVDPDLDSIDRLKLTEKQFITARHFSQIPFVSWILNQVASGSVAPLAKIMAYNKSVSAGITNFPGPGLRLGALGSEAVSVDFTVAGIPGVCGITFAVVSYVDHIKISALAEKGVMERFEVEQLVSTFSGEIENLYKRAVGKNNNSGDSTTV